MIFNAVHGGNWMNKGMTSGQSRRLQDTGKTKSCGIEWQGNQGLNTAGC